MLVDAFMFLDIISIISVASIVINILVLSTFTTAIIELLLKPRVEK